MHAFKTCGIDLPNCPSENSSPSTVWTGAVPCSSFLPVWEVKNYSIAFNMEISLYLGQSIDISNLSTQEKHDSK